MSRGSKIPLEQAERLAQGWVEKFRPFCDRVEVAGSIRRHKSEVGDIEICAIPGTDVTRAMGLYNLVRSIPRTKGKLPHEGARYTQFIVDPIKMDCFWCTRETWGLNFLIRTGSAEFSHALAAHSNRLGYEWKEARVYRADTRLGSDQSDDRDPIVLLEEEDVFRFFGLRWVPPEERTDAKALRRAIIDKGEKTL